MVQTSAYRLLTIKFFTKPYLFIPSSPLPQHHFWLANLISWTFVHTYWFDCVICLNQRQTPGSCIMKEPDHNEFYGMPTLQATVFCRRVLWTVEQSCKRSVWRTSLGSSARVAASAWSLPAPHASLLPITICSLRHSLRARNAEDTRQGKPGRQIKQTGSAQASLPGPLQASVIIQPWTETHALPVMGQTFELDLCLPSCAVSLW